MICCANVLGNHCKFEDKEGNTANDPNHEELPTSNTIDKKSGGSISDDRNR